MNFKSPIKDIVRPWYKLAHAWVKPLRDKYYLRKISTHVESNAHLTYEDLVFRTTNFINSCRKSENNYAFYFSNKVSETTLYSSVYACLAYKELGILENMNKSVKFEWCKFFDKYQNPDDGLFYDNAITDPNFDNSDWWGARHLALHIVAAYAFLDAQPQYGFKFLEKYKSPFVIKKWIDSINWESKNLMLTDIDNKIMNIGCLLQYERDRTNDGELANSVCELRKYLKQKINPETGMWGNYRVDVASELSAMVQFAYHLMPIFIYDRDFDFDFEAIANNVLRTQNRAGGFGCEINSSACEDIDSIDLLITCYTFCSLDTQNAIRAALKTAKQWVLANRVEDGGFVFRLFQSFWYGDNEMSADIERSSLFPTWFRLLSLNHIEKFEDNIIKPSEKGGYFALGTTLPKT